MISIKWLLKTLTLGLIVILNYSCVEEYDCDGFDTNHPILNIAVSTDLSEKLIFENESGYKIELEKHVVDITESNVERCGFSDNDCDCLTRMEIRYLDSNSDYYCGFEIWNDKAVDNSYHNTDYSFFSDKVFKHFYDIEYNNIENFIDSLTMDSVEYNGQIFNDIIEFSDTTVSNDYIDRFWIKPGIGLYKFWKNENCWTLKQ
jgi:hypothetical protein